MIEYGESVYIPAGHDGVAQKEDTRGPLGHWVRMEDPEYDQAFKEQSELEEKWTELREVTGDG